MDDPLKFGLSLVGGIEMEGLLKTPGGAWEVDESFSSPQELLQFMGAAGAEKDQIEEAMRALEHEFLNVYAALGLEVPYLHPTWWLFREAGMDDLYEKAGDSLDPMMSRLNIYPVNIADEGRRLFLARFEFPKYPHPPTYKDAILENVKNRCLGWTDHLAGFHYGDCEMIVLVGEVSSEREVIFTVYAADPDHPAPPVPDDFFAGYADERIVHNLLWLESDWAEGLCDGIGGEPEPESPMWWFRTNYLAENKFPYPGEFLVLAPRIFPNLPWFRQESHPFMFSGNFCDTVYFTSAKVTGIEPQPDGYDLYRLQWRKHRVKAYTTDFAKYKVGDRVTILKDVTTNKVSQLWKDNDMEDWNDIWRIVPQVFYGKNFDW